MGNVLAKAALGTRVPILTATADANVNRTAEITAMLSKYNMVRLGVGTFNITNISLASGQSIIGSGDGTILYQRSSVTEGYLITCAGNNLIKDLTIKSNAASATPAASDGVKHGILIQTDANYVKIDNCVISNFSGNGVMISNTGYNSLDSVHISNTSFRYNGVGVQLDTYGEYATITGCAFKQCYYGVLNNGGNNLISSCNFVANVIGFCVIGTDHANHGHGSCVACTFNHNTTYGIDIEACDNGFAFSGNQIHLNTTADIYLSASKGIVFSGGQFGASAKITISTGEAILIMGNMFNGAPTITVTDNVDVQLDNNYQYDGTAVTLS
jgi:hypothetical protein